MSARFGEVAILPHPAALPGPVHSLVASGSVNASGTLRLEFDLRADLRAVHLDPPGAQPGRRDELWRRSCFECFAGQVADASYLELNFSSSGDWAAYAFERYRTGRRDLVPCEVRVSTQSYGDTRLILRAQVDLSAWFAQQPAVDWATWRLNLAAVIEDRCGGLYYWAAHHPGARPDFHDRSAFRIVPRAEPPGPGPDTT